jgi:hypothetical protein
MKTRWGSEILHQVCYRIVYSHTVSKKLIHNRLDFACELNYGPENKLKPVEISGNKGRYHVLCYPKDQNFSHS